MVDGVDSREAGRGERQAGPGRSCSRPRHKRRIERSRHLTLSAAGVTGRSGPSARPVHGVQPLGDDALVALLDTAPHTSSPEPGYHLFTAHAGPARTTASSACLRSKRCRSIMSGRGRSPRAGTVGVVSQARPSRVTVSTRSRWPTTSSTAATWAPTNHAACAPCRLRDCVCMPPRRLRRMWHGAAGDGGSRCPAVGASPQTASTRGDAR